MRVYATEVGDEGGLLVGGCIYKATLLLRWAWPEGKKTLEQGWICQHGHYDWRAIPEADPRDTRPHPESGSTVGTEP